MMRSASHTKYVLLLLSTLAMLAFLAPQQNSAKQPDDKKNLTARLRVEVTGGDDNKPVAGASVYIKYPTNPKSQKSKMVELNIKTNLSGVTQSPEIPQGKVLIQIIAPDWKTYGEWHDVSQQEQTILIHLVRPAKWY